MKSKSRYKVLFSLVLATALVLAIASPVKNLFQPLWTMKKFQEQKLTWKSCYTTFECSTLKVPVDYQKIGKSIFQLQVLRHKATNAKQRIGSLVVNPGGPGGSGVDYAFNAEYIVSSQIYSRYDIIGFDPRGVNSSEPIRCMTDKQTDDFLANDGTANTPKQEKSLTTAAIGLANDCARAAGKKLGHYSTFETAKDMELLRFALHESTLNYLGKSYGTFLGTLYASLYPKSMGRFVLDGAVDPNVSIRNQNLAQAIGFDQALQDFIHQEHTVTLAQILNLIAKTEVRPLPSTSKRLVTPALVVTGIASSLYDNKDGWPKLEAALRQAIETDNGQLLLDLADEYSHRDLNGHYVDNQNDISQIISCLDWKDARSLAVIRADRELFAKSAPVFGPFLTFAGLACHYWQAAPVTSPQTLRNLKTPSLLVIGVTKDPATPYEWALALHSDLPASTLLTFVGDGHTGYNRGSTCIDSAVDNFLLTGQTPPKSLVCTA